MAHATSCLVWLLLKSWCSFGIQVHRGQPCPPPLHNTTASNNSSDNAAKHVYIALANHSHALQARGRAKPTFAQVSQISWGSGFAGNHSMMISSRVSLNSLVSLAGPGATPKTHSNRPRTSYFALAGAPKTSRNTKISKYCCVCQFWLIFVCFDAIFMNFVFLCVFVFLELSNAILASSPEAGNGEERRGTARNGEERNGEERRGTARNGEDRAQGDQISTNFN